MSRMKKPKGSIKRTALPDGITGALNIIGRQAAESADPTREKDMGAYRGLDIEIDERTAYGWDRVGKKLPSLKTSPQIQATTIHTNKTEGALALTRSCREARKGWSAAAKQAGGKGRGPYLKLDSLNV